MLIVCVEFSEVKCKILFGKYWTHSQEWGSPGIIIILIIFSNNYLIILFKLLLMLGEVANPVADA